MIIYDSDTKKLEIPVGLGNLEVNIISGGTPGAAGVNSLNGRQGNLWIKTINGEELLGHGNIVISGGTGPQGERGEQGAQGERGEQGAQGERGAQGAHGAQGERGPEGAQGAQGERGPEGSQGSTGTQGERGAQGERGEQGAQGERGAQGETGPQGATGPQGERGEQGPQGATGPQGPQGIVDYSNLVSSTTVNAIWVGTDSEYSQVSPKDPNTLYFIKNV